MSEIIGKRYQITKLIGRGGMAEVYLAWDSILNREVAVKVLKSDMSDDDVALERFSREAGAITQLSHPNIVDVYDVGDEGKKHYIVMEYVKGYTLKQLIKKRGAIPYKEAVWIMRQIAGALMEAHRNGIIHRDVKSQNVLIKPDGTIKLSDFGIALANGSMQITSKNSVLGSVHYLAPELSRGRHASMQSDIYSLGIVFYELLTGDVPYKAETSVQVALMHVKNNIPSVRKINPNIPQSVENIIIKATAKSISNRYKNIAIMLKDLNDCLKPEHKNDKKVCLDTMRETGVKQTMQAADELTEKSSKKKTPKLFIIVASLLSVIALVCILYLSGILNFGKLNKITVPNIIGLTALEAKDVLIEYNLGVDDSRTTYKMTDDIEKDKIISVVPGVGEKIDKNDKVKLVISEGIYSVLDNYVGKQYDVATKELKNKNFLITYVTVTDSQKKPGEVISQNPEAGYKYDEMKNNKITLTYAVNEEVNVIIDPSILYSKLDSAIKYFETNNIKYELQKVAKETLTEDILKSAGPNTVIKTSPEIGTTYDVNSEKPVIIYYYEDNSSTSQQNSSQGDSTSQGDTAQ